MAIIVHQLFSTKAYLEDIKSIFHNKVRIGKRSSQGVGPDRVELDQIAADIIDVSSSDLQKWVDDDSSLGNLDDVAIYVALKMLISRYTDSSWNYDNGSALNYLIPVNLVAQEVANNQGDYEESEQAVRDAQAGLASEFNPYQILGYSPYAIFDSICNTFSKKFALQPANSKFKDLLALALITDYSALYAGLDEEGFPLYQITICPGRLNRLIDPVAMADAIQYVYIYGFSKFNNKKDVVVSLSGFDPTHPLMCALASFHIRIGDASSEKWVDAGLRADWQVYRMKDFYYRYPSSIDRLIKTVSYADMVAILIGKQTEPTDEGNDIDPYASAYNLANIWGAYLNICKSTDQSLWIKYDCGEAEPYLYCPMAGRNDNSYGFINASSLPHILPEISASSFKSLRDNRINDRLLNLISSNFKIASSLSSAGINVCDCDGEWWPSSSSYYDKTPSVIYLSKNATFLPDESASVAKNLIKRRTKSLTVFDKRSYFVFAVEDGSVKMIKKRNSSQRLMSVFLGLADDYREGRTATSLIIDNAVKSNSQASMFDRASQLWQKSLVNANIELLTRQLIRSFDSSTRVSINPKEDFNRFTSVWYDKIITFITSENGFEDCYWINANLGPSSNGIHLISLNHHATETGCLGGGLQ